MALESGFSRRWVPTHRDYVLYLQAKLVKAETDLAAMTDKFERVKARFDRCQARRGITPKSDLIGYIDVESMNPELKFWYGKIEHLQREVTAYGAALAGLDAAYWMLASDGYRIGTASRRAGDRRRSLARAS